MSKNINVNPDHYKVAGRERQGEEIVHEDERHAFEGGQAHAQRVESKKPHIPNQEKASSPGGADAEASDTAGAGDETSQPLSDDEGMID
jgi:hypothetical protein